MNKRASIINNYIKKQKTSILQKLIPIPPHINISIVIPAYNEEKFLPSLLANLNFQSYKNFEVIVVDNNSNDSTLEISKRFQSKVSYPLLNLTESKPGPGYARKKGMDEILMRMQQHDYQNYSKHILVIADADIIPPINWLERILKNFQIIPSGALAGTHGADEKIDSTIEKQLGIKNFFNKIPAIIEYLTSNQIGKIKMSGSNSAFEIEAYASAEGIQQPFDYKNNRIGLKEVPQLGERIREAGYPILPMNTRVISNKRRQLLELTKNESMYFPSGYDNKSRFFSVREDENSLLKIALIDITKEKWIAYQKKALEVVFSNFIFKPLFINQIEVNSLWKILSEQNLERLNSELNSHIKASNIPDDDFIKKWSEIFEKAIVEKIT